MLAVGQVHGSRKDARSVWEGLPHPARACDDGRMAAAASKPSPAPPVEGVTLEQYAGVSAALIEGFPLPAVLNAEGLDARAWPRVSLRWSQRLAAGGAAGPLAASYRDTLAFARGWLGRRVAPLEDDLGVWLAFLNAWSAHPDGGDLRGAGEGDGGGDAVRADGGGEEGGGWVLAGEGRQGGGGDGGLGEGVQDVLGVGGENEGSAMSHIRTSRRTRRRFVGRRLERRRGWGVTPRKR